VRIIALEHERAHEGGPEYASILKDEARAVWNLAQAGVVREIYFRQDRPQAVIVLEAESVEAAQDILARLPLAKAGLIEFEVIGLQPYPGYARLFAK
jgi:muconolactone delta-isomerase